MLAASALAEAQALTIELTPGSLASALADAPADKTLTLTGSADARDLAALAGLPASYVSLDMSALSIVELKSATPVIGNRTYFPANEIPEYAFFKSPLTSIILPKGVSVIGDGAFAHSAITSIALPEGVRNLGNYAFYGCGDLASVSLPKTLATTGTGSFASCPRLNDVNLSLTALTKLPDRSFAGCSALSDIVLGSKVAVFGSEVFEGTAISALDLSNVVRFGDYALAGMSRLTNVTLNDNAALGKGLLMDDSALQNVSTSRTDIPGLFAANCTRLNLDNVVANASTIGSHAFANASADTLMLGSDLTHVGAHSFAGMSALSIIDARALGATVPEADATSFSGINPGSVKLYVADFTEDAWRNHPVWGEFRVESDRTTGVQDAVADASAITIILRAGHIVIDAPAPLEEVAVYTADGSVAGRWTTGSESARISLQDVPAGIVVVTARTAEDNRTVKLMTR